MKCIGGPCHGFTTSENTRDFWPYTMPKVSVLTIDPTTAPEESSTSMERHHYTRRRVVMGNGGDDIEYYAPAQWSDYEALLKVLT